MTLPPIPVPAEVDIGWDPLRHNIVVAWFDSGAKKPSYMFGLTLDAAANLANKILREVAERRGLQS